MVVVIAVPMHMPSAINIVALFLVQKKKAVRKSTRIKLVLIYIGRTENELQFISGKRIN